MRDRFDITLGRKPDMKPDQPGEAVIGVPQIELITGTAGRWDRSERDKARNRMSMALAVDRPLAEAAMLP